MLWGTRVIIPLKGRKAALEILHESHPGMGQMKSLARGYLWWPNLDKEIEQYVKRCSECQMSRSMSPAAPPHSWAPPEGPWSRVHIDYAGPFQGRMFLLLVDAHSKWLEIHETSTTTSSATIELLRRTFANVGLPQTIVSDNAPNFTSEEFTAFLKHNEIRHLRSAPYHPASNGIVERAVRTFKEGMRRLNSGSMNTRLSRFLFRYRITPLTASGQSPAELMWGRRLRSPLDLLVPTSAGQSSPEAPVGTRQFAVGESVYIRNYGSGPLWLPGVVSRQRECTRFGCRTIELSHVTSISCAQESEQTTRVHQSPLLTARSSTLTFLPHHRTGIRQVTLVTQASRKLHQPHHPLKGMKRGTLQRLVKPSMQ